MTTRKQTSDSSIAISVIAVLAALGGLMFAILATDIDPTSALGKLSKILNHPATFILLMIAFVFFLFQLITAMVSRQRIKEKAEQTFVDTTETIIRPVKLYQLEEDTFLTRTNFNMVNDKMQALARRGEDAVIDLVDFILQAAIKVKASDIHVEPAFDNVFVRYRIDGVLMDGGNFPSDLLARIVSRFRVLANLTIFQRGKPQDGRIDLRVGKKNYDVRISIVPTLHGEKAVIRLFESSYHQFDLRKLGMSESLFEPVSEMLMKQQGTIFLTGPTGSGKTTTTYAAIRYMIENRGETTNIITIEDPIECEIVGVNQTQVNPKRDLNFASGLRAILRQDPDVIMVGEVRDRETAEICTQAGLTGHLVISSIHAESSAGVVNRLIDMGIEPFLVASSVMGVISQRLVRRNCPDCTEPIIPSRKEMKWLGISPTEKIQFMRGKGCEKCHGRGYRERIGLYELLEITPEIRTALQRKVSTGELMDIAIANGLRTLKEDGIQKVKDGILDITELMRVCA